MPLIELVLDARVYAGVGASVGLLIDYMAVLD
jgi:hypothetical protein